MITTVSIGDDLISRLSLRSLFHLRQQMITAFQMSTERKWKILGYAMRGKWEKIGKNLDLIANNNTNAYSLNDALNQPSLAKRKSVKQAESNSRDSYDTSHLALPTHVIDIRADRVSDQSFPAIQSMPTGSASPPSMSLPENDQQSINVLLRPCILPGRVYHILRAGEDDSKISAWRRFFRKSKPRQYLVYAAAHETFSEVIISPNMMADHVPTMKVWKALKLPPEYNEDEPSKQWRCC